MLVVTDFKIIPTLKKTFRRHVDPEATKKYHLSVQNKHFSLKIVLFSGIITRKK